MTSTVTTPIASVKLVHTPEDSDEATQHSCYYKGDVYISIKDTIHQASTALRHTVETVKAIRLANRDIADVVVRTDGGPDHNMTFVRAQLAYLCAGIELGVDCLILSRTTAGQSYINPVERVMSVCNLGMYGMSLSRDHSGEATKGILKKCNTMKQRCIALKQADAEAGNSNHTDAFDKSMKVCPTPIDGICSM